MHTVISVSEICPELVHILKARVQSRSSLSSPQTHCSGSFLEIDTIDEFAKFHAGFLASNGFALVYPGLYLYSGYPEFCTGILTGSGFTIVSSRVCAASDTQ